MKRGLILSAVVAALAWGSGSAPVGGADDKTAPKGDAPYVHTVIFYLKKDAPKNATTDLIADAHTLLAKIPSVKNIKIGRPAEMSTPKYAVTDYQVGLLVFFENYDGLKTYLDHPLHIQYVEKNLKHVDKALVYDFANQTK